MDDVTFGMRAVGANFNPSHNPEVDTCKMSYANIIDNLHRIRNVTLSPEVKRMVSIAITELQTSQMWAVKAITWSNE